MIDKSVLTESEVMELKKIVLTKKKEQLEKELADIKEQSQGTKDAMPTADKLVQYFKD